MIRFIQLTQSKLSKDIIEIWWQICQNANKINRNITNRIQREYKTK